MDFFIDFAVPKKARGQFVLALVRFEKMEMIVKSIRKVVGVGFFQISHPNLTQDIDKAIKKIEIYHH